MPPSLVARGEKGKEREPEPVPVASSTSSLLHARLGLPNIPSCTVAEQFNVSGSPAKTGPAEDSVICTVGGAGAVRVMRKTH